MLRISLYEKYCTRNRDPISTLIDNVYCNVFENENLALFADRPNHLLVHDENARMLKC